MDAKILVLDIETTPTLAYVWAAWRQDIHTQQIVEPTRMLCFAAKWVGKTGTIFFSEKDHDMVHQAHALLDEADAVVTYNGDRFDIPHLYREISEQVNLMPPSPFSSIDLYRTAKRLKFFSHKLDYVSQQLGRRGKAATGGFSLWTDCMEGDEKAWRKMERYNRRDVVVTEQLYKDLLPWIKSHPNLNLYRAEGNTIECCPKCGGSNLQKRGYATTKVSKFQRLQCQECGSWSQEGKRLEGVGLRGVS